MHYPIQPSADPIFSFQRTDPWLDLWTEFRKGLLRACFEALSQFGLRPFLFRPRASAASIASRTLVGVIAPAS